MGYKRFEREVKLFEDKVKENNFEEAEHHLAELSKDEFQPENKKDFENFLERFLEFKTIKEPLTFYMKGKLLICAISEGICFSVPESLFSKGKKAAENARKQGLEPRFTKEELEYLESKTLVPLGLPEEVAVRMAYADLEAGLESSKKNPTAALETYDYLLKIKGYILENPKAKEYAETKTNKTFDSYVEKFVEYAILETNLATFKSKDIPVGVEVGRKGHFLRIGELQLEFKAKAGDPIYEAAKKAKLPILYERNGELKETGEKLDKEKQKKLEIDERNFETLEKNEK